jgi:cation:H+ antiporter
MNWHVALWLSGAGLVLLALGGEAVIRGGVMLKRAFGVSPVIIGLFVLSLGTSSPTLAVAVQGAASNLPDITIGVVIGAVLINLLLVLGLGALISPMSSAPKVVLRDGGAMLIGAVAVVGLSLGGTITARDGVVLLGGFAIYAVVAVVSDWRRSSEHSVACAEAEKRSGGEYPSIGGAVGVAAMAHLAPAAVALTGAALCASLPVLAITLIAVLRGHTNIAIGHLITASVFDIFGVLGISALVRPLSVSPVFARADVFVVLGAAVLLLPLLSANWRLTRPRGALLTLAYIGYLGFLCWRQGLIPHGMLGLA